MAEPRVCPRCRTINPPSARNCTNCGAVLLGTGGSVSLGMELPAADPSTGQTSGPANQSSSRPPIHRPNAAKAPVHVAVAKPRKVGCGCLVVSLALAVIGTAAGLLMVHGAATKGPMFVRELAERIVSQFRTIEPQRQPSSPNPAGVADLPLEARKALAQATALHAEAERMKVALETEKRREQEAAHNEEPTAGAEQDENAFLSAQKGGDGISKAAIARVIDRGRSRAKVCYVKQLAKNPQLHGVVKVGFVVLATGRVGEAKVLQPLADADELGQCLLRLVSSWQFPVAANGAETRVTFPFSFKK